MPKGFTVGVLALGRLAGNFGGQRTHAAHCTDR